jgi:hypothetical protein
VGADFSDKFAAQRLCEPGDELRCYTGPPNTGDVGLCKTGTRSCDDQGKFGPCEGEVLPRDFEDVATPDDDDCDRRDGSHRWTLTTGDEQLQQPLALAIEPNGDLIVAGAFRGTMNPAFQMTAIDGDQDAFMVRVGASGKPQSAGGLQVASTGEDEIAAIGVDGERVVIAGSLGAAADVGGIPVAADADTHAFVASVTTATRPSPTWSADWVMSLGGVGIQRTTGVSVDGGAGPVVAGWFDGSIDLDATIGSAGGEDGFVVAVDGTAIQWSLAFGGAGDDRATSVAPLGDGVVVTAVIDGRIPIAAAMVGADGKRSALAMAVSNGSPPSWIVELGEVSSGLPRVARGTDRVAVATALRGSVTLDVSHTAEGGDDLLVATLAADGTPVWSRRFGGSGDERPTGIAMDGDDVVVTGTFTAAFELGGHPLAPSGGTDGFLVRLRGDATVAYARAFAGTLDQLPAAMAAIDKTMFVAGSFDEVLDLGSSPDFGTADLFLSAFQR